MKINQTIFVSVGYGLISLTKNAETVTHQKNSIRNHAHYRNNLISSGFITHYPRKAARNSCFLSTPGDSSISHDDLESEPNENPNIDLSIDFLGDSNQNGDNKGEEEHKDINEDLSNLISVHSDMVKKGTIKEDLGKYDWFDDEPIDSSDEELMIEYYETKMPNHEEVYRQLDPLGIKNYVPDSSNSDVFLGRVYEVGESLIDQVKNCNTHTYEEMVEKSTKKRIQHLKENLVVDKNMTKEEFMEQVRRVEEEYDENLKKKLEAIAKQKEQECKQDDQVLKHNHDEDEFVESYQGADEFGFGKEFSRDSEDVAIEDDMCRFFLEIPLRSWVKDEVRAYQTSLKKIEKAQKYYTKPEEEEFVTDIRSVFKDSPMTTLGATSIFDNDEQNDSGENKARELGEKDRNEQNKLDNYKGPHDDENYAISTDKIKDLYIKEYNHNDLLNDIDKYESSKYPEVIEYMTERDKNQPIFILDPEKKNKDKKGGVTGLVGENVSDNMLKGKLRAYLGIPKNFIKFDDLDSVTISDSVAFRRNYDICTGRVIETIPLHDEYRIATVILPNQAGYTDQNIRYLADELAVNTKGLVFVPDIPVVEEEEWYFTSLNRLLKLIQAVYKVDRLSLVGLGDQGNLLLNYINSSMEKTISQYQSLYSNRNKVNNIKTTNEKVDGSKTSEDKNCGNDFTNSFTMKKKEVLDDFLENFSTRRIEDIMGRQSVPMLSDLLDGLQGVKLNQSKQMARKEKDPNIIKPVSKLVQSLVLYDTCNIDFEKLINLSIPTIVIQSNRTNLIDQVLTSESEAFLKIRDKKVYDPMLKGVNMFDYAIPEIPEKLKNLISRETNFRFIHPQGKVKRNTEQYYITSFHRGIDIVLHIFKEASPHFYMKKPEMSKLERNAIKDSMACCAKWILSWSY